MAIEQSDAWGFQAAQGRSKAGDWVCGGGGEVGADVKMDLQDLIEFVLQVKSSLGPMEGGN